MFLPYTHARTPFFSKEYDTKGSNPSTMNTTMMKKKQKGKNRNLKFPVLVSRLGGPLELLPESFGKDAFKRNVEFLAEHDG